MSTLPVTSAYLWLKDAENCLAFCYPKDQPPFAIRGRRDLVMTHVSNLGQSVPLIAYFLQYGKETHGVPTMAAYGLRKGFSVTFFRNTRMNPGTKHIERNRRNWIVVFKDKPSDVLFPSEVVYAKRVRQFHRGWMKELDPFIMGWLKIAAPLVHDGNHQDASKIAGAAKKIDSNKINHIKGAFIKKNKTPFGMNARKLFPKKVVLGNRLQDEMDRIAREAKEVEEARIKAEMEAKNAIIRKHRDMVLKKLRKAGVLPGQNGVAVEVFEVFEVDA